VVIDGTALQRLHDRKPVCVHEAALDGSRHLVPLIAAEEVEFRAVVVAVLRFDVDRASGGMARDDVDDASHRDVAIQARGGIFGDLDAIDALEWNAGPVHPSAERIVEGNAVEQDERSALTTRTDPSQR